MKRLLTVAICLLLALTFLVGCSAAPAPAPTAPHASEASPQASPPAEAPRAAAPQDSMAFDMSEMEDEFFSAGPQEDPNYFVMPILTPSDAPDRRMIYTVNMDLQTVDFSPGMRLIAQTVGEMGGFELSRDVRGSDMRRPPTESRVDFTFRLPSEMLPAFIFMVEDNFNIWRLTLETQDATARYQQTEAHLDNLQDQEQRLLEALEDVEDELDRAWLENDLSRVQGSIRDLETRQGSIRQNVIYSTLHITLHEAFLPEDIDELTPPMLPREMIIILALIAVAVLIGFIARKSKTAKVNTPSIPTETQDE